MNNTDETIREYQSFLHSELAATFAYFGDRCITQNNKGDEIGRAAIEDAEMLRYRAEGWSMRHLLKAPLATHRDYKFGTFNERLNHFCALFEIDRPEFSYDEDGEPLLTDFLMEWVKEHKVNLDWLFCGSPCTMIRDFAKKRAQETECTKIVTELDETEQTLMLMAMRAHIEDGLDFDGSMQVWTQAVKEYRAGKAAA